MAILVASLSAPGENVEIRSFTIRNPMFSETRSSEVYMTASERFSARKYSGFAATIRNSGLAATPTTCCVYV
jgi:hypothetical protein